MGGCVKSRMIISIKLPAYLFTDRHGNSLACCCCSRLLPLLLLLLLFAAAATVTVVATVAVTVAVAAAACFLPQLLRAHSQHRVEFLFPLDVFKRI